MGKSVVITNTALQAHEPGGADFIYTVTALPVHGTLKLKSIPMTAPGITFTQEDIDSGYLSYVHDGLDTTGDSFTFTLQDLEAAPNVSTPAVFDFTLGTLVGGFLLRLTPVGGVTFLLKFGRYSRAKAYLDAWTFTHLGTGALTELPNPDTVYTDLAFNENDANQAISDTDHFLDSMLIRTQALALVSTLQYSSTKFTHFVRQHGELLETTYKYLVEGDTDWVKIRDQFFANVNSNYHHWIGVLRLTQALLGDEK